MKKTVISIFITISLILTLFTSTIEAVEINVNNFNPTTHRISGKTYLVGVNGNQLFTQFYNNSSSYYNLYTLDKSIIDYCVCNDSIYVLYPSATQKNVYTLGYVDSNNIKEKFTFRSKAGILNTGKIIVDQNSNLYVINSEYDIEIINNGDRVQTISGSFNKLLALNNTCYGIDTNSIRQMSVSGVNKTTRNSELVNISKISDTYIINSANKVFYNNGSGFVGIMTIQCDNTASVTETDKYIVSSYGSKLFAYNKNTYKLQYSYTTNKDVYSISSDKNKITVIFKDFSYTDYYTDDIFKDPPKTNHATSENNYNSSSGVGADNNSTGTSSAQTKYSKLSSQNYVYAQQGTTIAQLRNRNEYTGCTVTFKDKKSGNIGTGMTFTVNNGKNEKQYTAIVIGDVTGEGNINSRDTRAMFNHLLNKETLAGAYFTAGDLNKDNSITNSDLVLLSKLIR